jgi:hypothetical protein
VKESSPIWDKQVKKRTRDRLIKQRNYTCLEDDLNGCT